MELSQHSLLEELIMAPNTPFSNEYLQNTWNLTSFDHQTILNNDFSHSPPSTNYISPSLLDLISPPDYDDHLVINSFHQPFLNALTSPELFGSFYDDLPPMAIHQDHAENEEMRFLESCINGFEKGEMMSGYSNNNVEMSAQNDAVNMDIVNVDTNCDGEKRSKSKKTNGQPSKNLMAERRRRKRLNDRLSMLRSIVPKISKMDRTSILGDTIDYVKELLHKIQKLREEGLDESATNRIDLIGDCLKELNPNETHQVRNPPKFDVERRDKDTKVEVCCATKPGLLLSTLSTLDALGLDIQQCVISCFSDFSLQASCFEVAEHRSLVSSEDVKQALFRNAGYGGRCL